MDKLIKNVFQSKLFINIKIKCEVKMKDFNSKFIFYYSKILLNFLLSPPILTMSSQCKK